MGFRKFAASVQIYFVIAVNTATKQQRNRGSSVHYEIGYDLLCNDCHNKAYSTVTHARVATDRAPRQARSHLLKELTAIFITIGGSAQRLFIPFVLTSVRHAGLPILGQLAEIE
jgi:hypothetical protein